MPRPNYLKDAIFSYAVLFSLAGYCYYNWAHPEHRRLFEQIKEDEKEQEKEIQRREKEFEQLALKRAAALKRREKGYEVKDYRW